MSQSVSDVDALRFVLGASSLIDYITAVSGIKS